MLWIRFLVFGVGRKSVCFLLFLQLFTGLVSIQDGNVEKELLKSLLSNYYSPSARPVKGHKESVEIKVQMSLIDVIKLDEVLGTATFKLWMSLTWKDHFLSWNLTEYNLRRTNIPTDHASIWLPDITIYNSLDFSLNDPTHPEAVCYHTGQVLWVRPILVTLPSRYEFKSNSWISGMKLGSWTYNLNSIDLQPYSGDSGRAQASFLETKYFSGSDRWELLDGTSSKKITSQECCEELHASVHITIYFKKKTRIS